MTKQTPDTQIVELMGRNWLTNELYMAGFEVARPQRDRGIDLIVYSDLNTKLGRFVACPIQMKAASKTGFGMNRKYEKFPNLMIAYVWHLSEPHRTVTYAMTYNQAVAILKKKGYTRTPSWTDKGSYSVTNPGPELLSLIESYRMTPERWKRVLTSISPPAAKQRRS
jgi:hypothetical protein